MKTSSIRLMVAVLFGLAATSVAAQGVVVYKSDGTNLYLKDSELESIEFYEADEEPNPDPQPTDPVKTFTVTGNGKTVTFNMMLVEAGTFLMGSTSGDSNEQPVHQVMLTRNYYMGETEVTQALWYAVMGLTPTAEEESQWTSTTGLGDNYPAYDVNWDDCQEFITKLNQMTGATFRLPTEAEWEFAVKGGNKSQGYTYAGGNTLNDVAWNRDNSQSLGRNHPDYGTHAVATKAPNELGLYDMSGNVWELCQDWYGSYSSSAQTDPTGPTSGSLRVLRGGSWDSDAANCRVADRGWTYATYRSGNLGFRLGL